ncbi:MAG: DUF899 domain-containing protein [Myxacorys californica WJT36-NPBG1]|nr:DUF899 domain-containing protein [Myxacorys californica WJT36-NPBG1]
MIKNEIAHPRIAAQEEWLAARKSLLEHEKEATQHRDRVNAERRRLPMVKLEKEYTFEGANGPATLADLFDGRIQLIVYHFMFDPEWDKGCTGCTSYVDSLSDLSMLNDRETTFVLVSRAPLPKLEAYKSLRGWSVPWYSSFGNDFNYDFHVTLDENVAPIEYNYRDKAEMERRNGSNSMQGEGHGLSVFFRVGDDIFYTYSTYARGVEGLTNAYSLLDVTPYGRQEAFEDSPSGYPQKPTYG